MVRDGIGDTFLVAPVHVENVIRERHVAVELKRGELRRECLLRSALSAETGVLRRGLGRLLEHLRERARIEHLLIGEVPVAAGRAGCRNLRTGGAGRGRRRRSGTGAAQRVGIRRAGFGRCGGRLGVALGLLGRRLRGYLILTDLHAPRVVGLDLRAELLDVVDQSGHLDDPLPRQERGLGVVELQRDVHAVVQTEVGHRREHDLRLRDALELAALVHVVDRLVLDDSGEVDLGVLGVLPELRVGGHRECV